ncbi:MAG: TetR/AcrR family transcriptional regulator [Anaerolineales bacterium]
MKRTRQLLIQALIDLMKEKGFQTISVQNLSERAGINRATFYAHFPDKFALLEYFIREGFQREIDERMLNACQFSLQNLRTLIIAVCEFVTKVHSNCVPSQNQYESLIESEIKNQVSGLMLKWLKQVGTDPSLELTATAVSWAIYGLASQWSHDKDRPAVEVFADQVLPMISANFNLALEIP